MSGGEVHWLPPMLVIVGGLVVFGMVMLAGRPSAAGRAWRRLRCPKSGQPERVRVVWDELTGDAKCVAGCEALPSTFNVTCDEGCLDEARCSAIA